MSPQPLFSLLAIIQKTNCSRDVLWNYMKAGIPVANAWMAYAKCRYKPEAKILHHSFPFTIWIFVLAAALINLSLLPRTLDQNWTGEGSCLWKQLFSSTLSPKQLPFFETKTEPERGSKLKKKAPRHKIGAWKAQRQIADCFVGKCLSSPVFRKEYTRMIEYFGVIFLNQQKWFGLQH